MVERGARLGADLDPERAHGQRVRDRDVEQDARAAGTSAIRWSGGRARWRRGRRQAARRTAAAAARSRRPAARPRRAPPLGRCARGCRPAGAARSRRSGRSRRAGSTRPRRRRPRCRRASGSARTRRPPARRPGCRRWSCGRGGAARPRPHPGSRRRRPPGCPPRRRTRSRSPRASRSRPRPARRRDRAARPCPPAASAPRCARCPGPRTRRRWRGRPARPARRSRRSRSRARRRAAARTRRDRRTTRRRRPTSTRSARGPARRAAKRPLPRKKSQTRAGRLPTTAATSSGVTRGPRTWKTGVAPCAPPWPQANTTSGASFGSVPASAATAAREMVSTRASRPGGSATRAGASVSTTSDRGRDPGRASRSRSARRLLLVRALALDVARQAVQHDHRRAGRVRGRIRPRPGARPRRRTRRPRATGSAWGTLARAREGDQASAAWNTGGPPAVLPAKGRCHDASRRPARLPDRLPRGLLAYGYWALGFDVGPAQIVVTLGAALAAQYAFGRAADLPRFDPKSALISGLSLCLLLRTDEPLLAAVGARARDRRQVRAARPRQARLQPDELRADGDGPAERPRVGVVRPVGRHRVLRVPDGVPGRPRRAPRAAQRRVLGVPRRPGPRSSSAARTAWATRSRSRSTSWRAAPCCSSRSS